MTKCELFQRPKPMAYPVLEPPPPQKKNVTGFKHVCKCSPSPPDQEKWCNSTTYVQTKKYLR